jgi:N-acetylglutamate synthase-like GNAT family acetyltransferase
MNANAFRIRRATIEDLPALTALWQSMNLASAGLDRRLTEFQVATDEAGKIVGAIGFQLLGKQALLHSEAFVDFGIADLVRPLLWERLQVLAANHGTIRVWTRETAPFWSHNIFSKPDADAHTKLPPVWNESPEGLLTIKLREDVEEILSLDKEFALFAESERERSRTALNQAKVLKTVATVAALILGVIVLIASVLLVIQKTGPSGN